MKKIVPFSKTIQFKTMISEITDIEVKHNLELTNETNEIEGDILIDGKYKITSVSGLEEEFHYKLPFVIAVDSKYVLDNLEINIGTFNYEIINEEKLKVDVEIELDNIEEKELTRFEEIKIPIEVEEDKEKVEILDELDNIENNDNNQETIEIDKEENIKKSEKETNIGSIFSNLTKTEETFSTYHVYIVRENDTIESILDKYNISRDELANYNDLDDVKLGTKLIIPCHNE